ncbi:MAG: metallophosphoesterase [Thermoplasmata archaeon]|nr:metallophosphoesterase [Thermoplasmata archaeon]
MREHLVAYFEAHHKLVESGALNLLLAQSQPLILSRQVVEVAGAENPFVTQEMVERALSIHGAIMGPRALRPATDAPMGYDRSRAAPASVPYALVAEGFNPGPGGREPLEAYGTLFQSRYRALSRILKGRPELSNLRPVRELRSTEGASAVIGMVREVHETSEKHHVVLTVEDETGSLEVLVLRGSPPARATYLVDEVVGLKIAFPREPGRLPKVLAVERPEMPPGRSQRRSERTSRVLFLSDTHVGSRSFLSDAWGMLADFLKEKGPEPELAREVEHVVIAGDLVDGIGIYPNQERDLAIGDIFEQYGEFGKRLRELPSRLNIVVLPGNHDAVCPAEPQPALPEAITSRLPENVRAVGNPSTFALEGVVVEAYHGRSFDDLIPALPGASYARPTDVMKRMLAMRHLAPMYGGRTPLAPLPRDGLVIDPAPDILVTGHAHTYGVDQYRGVLLLNASTWQAETEYQRMRNISPVPAHAALVNLSDLTLRTLDFSGATPAIGSRAA